ncbi:hypothetical protein CC80DRAFT_548732 [Byssothecium circinans]|uniref:Uncharacterized protein n=1 Tax=Byssothecium circinans TaxID=147558 RepID=A0A6A5TXJ7_9PLEO|nr:hypothetical protein CC80DRAFT_548732 [Byssothecium circinans]
MFTHLPTLPEDKNKDKENTTDGNPMPGFIDEAGVLHVSKAKRLILTQISTARLLTAHHTPTPSSEPQSYKQTREYDIIFRKSRTSSGIEALVLESISPSPKCPNYDRNQNQNHDQDGKSITVLCIRDGRHILNALAKLWAWALEYSSRVLRNLREGQTVELGGGGGEGDGGESGEE